MKNFIDTLHSRLIEEEMDESLRESCSACHTQLQEQLTSYSNLNRSEINAQKRDI